MFKVFLFLWVFQTLAYAGDITVAGAANIQFTLEDLKAEFTRETGISVKAVFSSSGKLTAQIENGAPFDIFMSADMKYPERLYQDGFSSQAPKVYAYGRLVLWTMKNIDLSKGIPVLSEAVVQKIALADPQLAPYGLQAVHTLKFYQLFQPLKKKYVIGENISQVNQFITTGAADIGLTAQSVVLAPPMKDKGKWVQVDPQSYEPIAQGVIVLKYAQQNHSKEAREFYEFLFSSPAQEIFKKYGYKLP
ncbi:MAG: molybdate ABC transporter substrate-binding protein [Candidatus Omnitrophica bacterium]|nr:molybdate ABC transporter substrate-binding protein [Candidatus Omnitrophota bacterium]